MITTLGSTPSTDTLIFTTTTMIQTTVTETISQETSSAASKLENNTESGFLSIQFGVILVTFTIPLIIRKRRNRNSYT